MRGVAMVCVRVTGNVLTSSDDCFAPASLVPSNVYGESLGVCLGIAVTA